MIPDVIPRKYFTELLIVVKKHHAAMFVNLLIAIDLTPISSHFFLPR